MSNPEHLVNRLFRNKVAQRIDAANELVTRHSPSREEKQVEAAAKQAARADEAARAARNPITQLRQASLDKRAQRLVNVLLRRQPSQGKG